MPKQPPDLPITITHSIAFSLLCPVSRGITYLSDPEILLGALPSVEHVVARQRGTYRLTLAPIRSPGHTIRPAAEVTIAAMDDRVTIQSVAEEPHALQANEVATRVSGTFRVTATAAGCDIRATLHLAASIPPRAIPPLMPRALAHRTAEGILGLRMRQELHATARALVADFAAWDAEHRSATRGQQPAREQ
jgi:hypothetical protein